MAQARLSIGHEARLYNEALSIKKRRGLFANETLEVAGSSGSTIAVFETTNTDAIPAERFAGWIVGVFAIGVFGAILKIAGSIDTSGESTGTITSIATLYTDLVDTESVRQRTVVVLFTLALAFDADRTADIGAIPISTAFFADPFVADLPCLAILIGKTTGNTGVGLGVTARLCLVLFAMRVFGAFHTYHGAIGLFQTVGFSRIGALAGYTDTAFAAWSFRISTSGV